MPRPVLILDADQRSALATVRSLGSRGLRVITADVDARTLAGSSRFSSISLRYPDPAAAPAAFVDAIQNTIKMNDITVVMPMTDVTTMVLIQHRETLAPAKLGCASADSYEQLTNKMKLMQIASELGIPVPSTHVAHSAAEVIHFSQEQPFPQVLKPGRSRYISGGRIYATRVRIASSFEELKAILKESPWLDHDIPCLVQQYIPGHGAGVFALSNGSRVVAWFAHRRIREKPPTGGVSVLCESVPVDTMMRQYAQLLLASAKWIGPAMVEFRVGSDAVPYLMEVNGRFWGSLQLAINSGVDFPWLWYKLLTGNSVPVDDSMAYRTGRRLRWLLGDLDNLLVQLKTKGLPAAHKTRAITDFLRSFVDSSCKQEVFCWSDPGPAVRELSTWLRTLG
jgi:predicted ATP-grasp superfamily ATP-dependent carboligase